MKVPIINQSKHPLPVYQTDGAAAFDLQANLDQPLVLGSLERALIPTGLYAALPSGYELQVRSRGSLPIRYGIIIGNSPGTVDADYRGEIKVIIINASNEPYTIHDGDRIAQGLVAPVEKVEWVEVEELDETARGP
ncbi:MAG: dUTP diphosphatase [Candidatus Saccharimonadales bacterium]